MENNKWKNKYQNNNATDSNRVLINALAIKCNDIVSVKCFSIGSIWWHDFTFIPTPCHHPRSIIHISSTNTIWFVNCVPMPVFHHKHNTNEGVSRWKSKTIIPYYYHCNIMFTILHILNQNVKNKPWIYCVLR